MDKKTQESEKWSPGYCSSQGSSPFQMLSLVSCITLDVLRISASLNPLCLSRLSGMHSNRNCLGRASGATGTQYQKVLLDTIVMLKMTEAKYQNGE